MYQFWVSTWIGLPSWPTTTMASGTRRLAMCPPCLPTQMMTTWPSILWVCSPPPSHTAQLSQKYITFYYFKNAHSTAQALWLHIMKLDISLRLTLPFPPNHSPSYFINPQLYYFKMNCSIALPLLLCVMKHLSLWLLMALHNETWDTYACNSDSFYPSHLTTELHYPRNPQMFYFKNCNITSP